MSYKFGFSPISNNWEKFLKEINMDDFGLPCKESRKTMKLTCNDVIIK